VSRPSPGGLVAISTSSFARADRRPLERLEAAGFRVRLSSGGRRLRPEETIDLLRGAIGLIAGTETLDREVLAACPDLAAISRCGAGLDNVDLQAAAERGIRVTRVRDAHAEAVAELALAGILALLRHLPASDRGLRSARWSKPMGRLLAGKTVGLVGLGHAGKALVRLLAPFRPVLLATDPSPDPAFAADHGVEYRPLDELLRASDVVSLHLAYSEQVHHLLDRRRLALMKPESLLVNTARGGLVDEAALAEALRDGRVAGAYLDVFEHEPYQGPLTGLDNALLTPHIGSYASEARAAMEMEAVENLLEALS
jgi:D-3-phosphoglycerate dehydrogenase